MKPKLPVPELPREFRNSSAGAVDNKGIMNRLAFNSRHFNVSLIIDSQSLRQINNAFRNTLSGIIVFAGINNILELKNIYEEYLGSLTQKEATALLN